MESCAFVVFLSCFFHAVSTDGGLLQGFLRQGNPCFEITKVPDECDKTLAESFTPKSPNMSDNKPETLVFLFTPNKPDTAEPLHLCGGLLPSDTTYDPNVNTEIFIHGWLDGVCRTAWMREMKEQVFLRGKYNVVLIDWTWGNTPNYVVAGGNSRIVGEQLGFVINNIMQQTGAGPEKFHLVGHSFGAIASGFAGRRVKGLRRITALDPAYAPFGKGPPNQRITYRDAQIVDVIHSNGFQNFAQGIGDIRQLGHADFYPNGGQYQTSCYTYMLESLLKFDLLYAIASLVDTRLCSHLQAIQFYKESINSRGCEYVGVACQSYENFKRNSSFCDWAVMGMNYECYHRPGRRKKFFLNTTKRCPYYDDSYLHGKKFPFKTSCSS